MAGLAFIFSRVPCLIFQRLYLEQHLRNIGFYFHFLFSIFKAGTEWKSEPVKGIISP